MLLHDFMPFNSKSSIVHLDLPFNITAVFAIWPKNDDDNTVLNDGHDDLPLPLHTLPATHLHGDCETVCDFHRPMETSENNRTANYRLQYRHEKDY